MKSESLVASVTDSAEQLSKALAEVRLLLQTFGKGNGSIQKLLTDPTVYQNLDGGRLAGPRDGPREKITRDLEVFADKIARRPELIGVGGALRPSSGLKDLPGTSLPAYRTDWPPALPGTAPGRIEPDAAAHPGLSTSVKPPRSPRAGVYGYWATGPRAAVSARGGTSAGRD